MPALRGLRLDRETSMPRRREHRATGCFGAQIKGRPIPRLTAGARALTYRHHGTPRVLSLDVGPGCLALFPRANCKLIGSSYVGG
jgi:hypothetical protein